MREIDHLSNSELDRYEWQLDIDEFGVEGQKRLKGATVFISRCGGLGGIVAYELAAAGIGKLVIAHGGVVLSSDLNRQLLMTSDWVGKPRIESIERRLRELNPEIEIITFDQNVNVQNAEKFTEDADIIVDCAPLFEERFAMNNVAVKRNKILIECAMFGTEAQITSIKPGSTPCLRCLFPENPPLWKRRFPVFGAVSGSVGCLAAMEVIKIIGGFGDPLYNQMILMELSSMTFRKISIQKRINCPVCSQSNV